MASLDTVRNEIIGKILSITDKSLLNEIYRLTSVEKNDTFHKTTQEQKLMLELSDNDIANGKTIVESDLNSMDLQWLKEL